MRMSIGAARESTVGVIALLVVICAGLVWLSLQVPQNLCRFVGSFLVCIGALNVFLSPTLGKQSYAWARSMPPFVANFWERNGEKGAQFLYLGTGIVLTTIGILLLLKSFLRHG
jgi:hypothetical protein